MTPPDLRASARCVAGTLRDWFGEREIGPTTVGIPAARFIASQDRPQPRICAAHPVGPANEALEWHACKGFSLAAEPGGRLEPAYVQFDRGLGPDLTEQYVAELAQRGWTCKRGAWAKPAADHAGL